MREDNRAVISLPDRLAHVFIADDKLGSPSSAPSILEATHNSVNDAREDSIVHPTSDDRTESSRHPECVSTCRSVNGPECPPYSPVSTLTSESLREKSPSRESQAIDLSLKFLSGVSKDAKSETSLMPGVRYTNFNDFAHSGLLDSNLSKNIKTYNDSKLIPKLTVRTEAKIGEKLNKSKARKIATLERHGDSSPPVTTSREEVSLMGSKMFAAPSETFSSDGHGLTFDDSELKPPSSFHLSPRTPVQGLWFQGDGCIASEQGEEYTLDDFEDNVASGDETVKKRPAAHRHWSGYMMQPDLQEPTGLLLAFDLLLDCFDKREEKVLDLSPAHTLDTWNYSLYDEAELENDGIDWLLPCWNDGGFGSGYFPDFDESTLGDVSLLQGLQSKGSIFGSGETESLSHVERLFVGLEFEPAPSKDTTGDRTRTTDGDSTLSPDPSPF
jgi:hypothetical protein